MVIDIFGFKFVGIKCSFFFICIHIETYNSMERYFDKVSYQQYLNSQSPTWKWDINIQRESCKGDVYNIIRRGKKKPSLNRQRVLNKRTLERSTEAKKERRDVK